MADETANRARVRHVYRSYPALIATGDWTVADIKVAIASHEIGQFQRSALLCDAMGREDLIVSALDTLILGVLRLPFRLDPASEDEAAELCRTALGLVWSRVMRDDQLYEALRWLVMMGFVLVELIWNTDDPEQWTPERVHVWHPQFIYWREDIRVFVLQTTDGPVEVDPENLGGKWMLIAPGGARAWMRGAVRSLADDFVSLAETKGDWRRHSEVHGGGIMKAITPAGVGDDKDKTAYVNSIAALGSEPVVECPRDKDGAGYDLEILETGKDHAAGFKLLLDEIKASINVRILGQNASTENSGPYVAKGGLFAKVTLDRIDGIVGPLEQAMREHVARPFAEFNFGDAELAPIPDYDSEPPPDKAAQATTMATVGQAALSLKSAGWELDPDEVHARFGFTLRRAKQVAAPPVVDAEVAA